MRMIVSINIRGLGVLAQPPLVEGSSPQLQAQSGSRLVVPKDSRSLVRIRRALSVQSVSSSLQRLAPT